MIESFRRGLFAALVGALLVASACSEGDERPPFTPDVASSSLLPVDRTLGAGAREGQGGTGNEGEGGSAQADGSGGSSIAPAGGSGGALGSGGGLDAGGSGAAAPDAASDAGSVSAP